MFKILIISSDNDFTRGIKSDAHFWDFIVQTSDNAEDPVELVNKCAPDLLIIDFILNDSNGGAVCHQLKSNSATHLVPIILLSEYPGILRFTTKFGCDLLLKKSIDRYTLYNSVVQLLNPSHFAAGA